MGLPLVIVNACETGAAQRMGSENLGAFSRAFLSANASAFLGSLWKTPINSGERFIQKILESSIGGDEIGEAVRKAREEHYGENGMWAMFVLYGQPDFRIWEKSEPE